MAAVNILAHENTRLIERNDFFSLYLYSGTVRKDLSVLFQSDELAIFVCLSGKFVSSTESLSYNLSERLVSFALRHNCRKMLPADIFTEFIIITFTQQTLEKLIETAGENVKLTMSHFTSCQCTVHNCNSEIMELSRKLLNESTEKYWGHRVKTQFTFQELLISFVRLFTADKEDEVDKATVVAKQILEAFPDKNLDLEELADKCGVSKSHLCRVFKKATGQTVSQYLNHIRIERACRLLADTGVPIEEIAFASGFNNASYFFRVFKKQVGKLPLEWRKKHSVASQIDAKRHI
ncbi:MAG: AraC family transcriptional regulator [Candidatus Riflebacteria bacterium]|nr:AraC family transcriptional regulator [Candidatus Riflebacteria bacterium]